MKKKRRVIAALLDFTIGQNAKRLRVEIEVSQARIARLLAVTQSHYSKMESGQVAWTAYQLMTLCRIFTVTPKELVNKVRTDN